jgi:hypothetical protein
LDRLVDNMLPALPQTSIEYKTKNSPFGKIITLCNLESQYLRRLCKLAISCSAVWMLHIREAQVSFLLMSYACDNSRTSYWNSSNIKHKLLKVVVTAVNSSMPQVPFTTAF